MFVSFTGQLVTRFLAIRPIEGHPDARNIFSAVTRVVESEGFDQQKCSKGYGSAQHKGYVTAQQKCSKGYGSAQQKRSSPCKGYVTVHTEM